MRKAWFMPVGTTVEDFDIKVSLMEEEKLRRRVTEREHFIRDLLKFYKEWDFKVSESVNPLKGLTVEQLYGLVW